MKRRRHNPVRTGLLASSAALAVGAIGVSSGLLPTPNGSGGYSFQNSNAGQIQAGGQPSTGPQGGESPLPPGRPSIPASRGNARPSAPATPPAPPARANKPTPQPSASSSAATTAPAPSATPSGAPTADPSADPTGNAAAQVLALVNIERAKIGCAPLTADRTLAKLASDFSKDMAKRTFFDHVDPDGKDPWARALALGITTLGGENIARGQADAQAVMTAWMNSPGHRANILNCDYQTLGVGVQFGAGGPWWTQDFGF